MIKIVRKVKDVCIEEPNFLYYNGFEIQVIPIQSKKTLEWSYKVWLYRHREEQVKKRVFTDKYTTRSKDEAIKKGFEFGQKIIDGKNRKYSVKGIK